MLQALLMTLKVRYNVIYCVATLEVAVNRIVAS